VLYDRGKMGKETEEGNVSLQYKIREAMGLASDKVKKKISNNLDYIKHTIEFALEGGFKIVTKPNLDLIRHPIKFTRIDIFGKEEVFEIYLSTLTIRTNIVHPKSRKNQAYRTALPLEILKQMLTNVTGRGKGLRLHADNLYRQKKRRKDLEKKRREKDE
jgi:hypothetical protein